MYNEVIFIESQSCQNYIAVENILWIFQAITSGGLQRLLILFLIIIKINHCLNLQKMRPSFVIVDNIILH